MLEKVTGPDETDDTAEVRARPSYRDITTTAPDSLPTLEKVGNYGRHQSGSAIADPGYDGWPAPSSTSAAKTPKVKVVRVWSKSSAQAISDDGDYRET